VTDILLKGYNCKVVEKFVETTRISAKIGYIIYILQFIVSCNANEVNDVNYKNQSIQQNLILIDESKRRSQKWGLDPNIIPEADEISNEQLQIIQNENKDVLKVVEFFIPEFLVMVQGTPLLIVVTNDQGIVTYIEGDNSIKTITQELGFRTGVKFNESYNGTNSISLALNHNIAIEVIGGQHYHEFLSQSACYTVPFYNNETDEVLGTVSIMTAVDFASPLLLSLLSIVGTSIEREILLRKKNKNLNVLNQVLIETSQTAMILTDPQGHITEFNHYAEKLTGLKRENILNENAWQLKQVGEWIQKIIQTKENITNVEVKLKNMQTGAISYCLFDGKPIYSESGKLIGTVGSFRDITERYENQQIMNQLAHHDDLTGLPNRRYFHKYVEDIIQQLNAIEDKVALFHLDLDRFKLINDTLGHAKGDTLLSLLAQRLLDCLNNRGKLFRMGGDEFTIVIKDVESRQEVISIAQDILDVVRAPYVIQGFEFYVSVSIGISLYPEDGDDIHKLLGHADTAMYQAKNRGKNRFLLYSAEMKEQSLQKLTLETELELAIENNDLQLYYQPQIDLTTNQIVGLEALLRWNHPELGLIPPAEFIPVAEEMGLMVNLGEWILLHACRQMKVWHGHGLSHLKIAVNLSPQEFLKEKLVEKVQNVLLETELPPECLELEITESMTMDVERSISILEELAGLGVQIAIDDFGTGFSSLNYLKNFHIHRLKIDQTFIRDMMDEPIDAKIVGTIIAMAHNMKLNVIAEGVETEEQLTFLRNLQCDEVQGYFYSMPLSADDIEEKYKFLSSKGVVYP
jgi:diguanylate cyclase (GGDEF)-like protein/PAS domain S-box-containing protein